MSAQVRGATYAFAAAMCFGLGVVLARILGTQLDAPVVAFTSLAGGGILLIGYLVARGAAPLRWLATLDRAQWIDLCLLAGVGTAGPLILIVTGFATTDAVTGGFIIQLNGVAALLFALLLLGERMLWRQSFGILLVLAGSAAVILAGPASGQTSHATGDLLILLGSIGIGYGFIPAKRLGARVDVLLLTAWRLLLGAAMLLPIFVGRLLIAGHSLLWQPAPTTLLIALPAYIVTNFCLAYVVQQAGLRLLKAWEMAVVMQTVPLFSSVLAVLLLHDHITLAQGVGGLVAIAGGLIVALRADGGTAPPP